MLIRYQNYLYGMYETDDMISIYTREKIKTNPNFRLDMDFGRYVYTMPQKCFRENRDVTEMFELVFLSEYRVQDDVRKGKFCVHVSETDIWVQEPKRAGFPCTLDRICDIEMWKPIPIEIRVQDIDKIEVCASYWKSGGIWHVPSQTYRKRISMDELKVLFVLYRETSC